MADFGGMFDSDQESGDDVIDHIPKTPGPVTMHHDSGEDEEEDEDENDGDEQHQQQQQQQQERREQNDEESGSDDSEDENQYQKNVQEEDEESGNQESRAKSSDEGSGSEQESEDEKPARNRVTSQSEENDSEVERSGDEKSVSEGPGSPQQESDSEADIQRPEPSESSRDGGGEDGEENEANKILAGGQSNREVEEDSDEEPQKSRQEIKSEDEQSKSDNDDNDEQREQAPPDEDSNDSNDSGPQKRKLSIVEDRDSDSDQDSDGPPRSERKKVKIDSDEDEDAMEENDSPRKDSVTANTKEIFGELSSEGEENEEKKASTVREEPRRVRYDSDGNEDISRVGDDDNRRDENNTSVYFGDEPPEEPVPETRIDVEIPRIVANLGQEITFVKLPNFLSVDTHPYQPDWYDEEGLDDEEGGFDDEGRARVKLKVENTMRWRAVVGENGEQVKESNTRMVKWSDGSMSLYLGSEIFDVHKQQLMPGENNHLFVRQGTGLQGQAVFRNKLTFRPHSTDSFTHRKMTISLADRSQKTQKIRVLAAVGDDPEADRREKLKREEDKLKASLRRESKQRRMRERVNTRGPTASYLENDNYDDEDDEGAISLSAIKNKYKKGNVGYNVYTESEGSDDSDDILDRKKSNAEKKKPQIVDSEDED